MNGLRRTRAGAVLLAGLAIVAGGARAQTSATPAEPPAAIAAPSTPAPVPAPAPTVEAVGAVIIVRDAAFEAGPASVRAPRIEIVGSTLGAGEIAALLTGEGDPATRLRGFNAKEVTIPDLSFVLSLANGRQETRYRDLRLLDIAEGRIGRLTSASASVEATNPDYPVTGEMTGISVDRIDYGAALGLAFGPSTPGAPATTLYERFKIDRYAFKTGADTMEMRGLVGSGFRMASVGRPLVDLARDLSSVTKESDPATAIAAIASARPILAAVELDETRIDSLDIVSGKEGAHARLDGMWVRDVRQGRVSLGLDAMRIDGKEASVTTRGLEILDYDQLGVLDAITKFGGSPQALADINPAALIPTFRRIAVASVVSCKPPREGCAAADADFVMEGAALERAQVAEGLDWTLAIKRFHTPASGDRPASDGATSGLIAWRPEARRLTLNHGIKLQGYGEASASFDLENVMPQIFTEPRTAAMIALAPLAARRAGLRLVDEGGVDKIAAKAAEKAKADAPAPKPGAGQKGAKGKAPNAAAAKPLAPREALARQVESKLAGLGDAAAAKALASALAGFLRDSSTPLTVTVVAEPAIGAVNFLGLKDYRSLLLRLTTTSERR